jgi:hypothetical protein
MEQATPLEIKPDKKTARFVCSLCKKEFCDGGTFTHHITSSKLCTGIIDNKLYIQRQIPHINNQYEHITAIIDNPDIDINEKKRFIRQTYRKALKVLAALRKIDYTSTDGLDDDIVRKLIRMTLNMKNETYENVDWKSINIKNSFTQFFDKKIEMPM